jgi:hypothetical protein
MINFIKNDDNFLFAVWLMSLILIGVGSYLIAGLGAALLAVGAIMLYVVLRG